MNKDFYQFIATKNESLFSAIIHFNIENLKNYKETNSNNKTIEKLYPYIEQDFLNTYFKEKSCIHDPKIFTYWNYADETKRLLLLDKESLSQLILRFGITIHAREISLIIKRDDVLTIKKALGEENYFYALTRAKYRLNKLCDFYKNKNQQLDLITKILQNGQNALFHCTTTWEKELKVFFINKYKEEFPYLTTLMQENNETIPEDKKRLIWLGIKKILIKEVNSSWLPYFN